MKLKNKPSYLDYNVTKDISYYLKQSYGLSDSGILELLKASRKNIEQWNNEQYSHLSPNLMADEIVDIAEAYGYFENKF
ncbi:hypothetical protein CUS96_12325 [Enterococcus faecium]|uniref:hypothetical protein n=1 Tax=Enterococcus faecium TaxID=1352 RepID=UPI000CF1D00D|nr:hypothetical protein [Enterococcus faecium]PQF11506.1 hypothetical protein CUS96_12325 [Enterococcus faecium]